jgi:hypothetical protein
MRSSTRGVNPTTPSTTSDRYIEWKSCEMSDGFGCGDLRVRLPLRVVLVRVRAPIRIVRVHARVDEVVVAAASAP